MWRRFVNYQITKTCKANTDFLKKENTTAKEYKHGHVTKTQQNV